MFNDYISLGSESLLFVFLATGLPYVYCFFLIYSSPEASFLPFFNLRTLLLPKRSLTYTPPFLPSLLAIAFKTLSWRCWFGTFDAAAVDCETRPIDVS